MNCHIENTSRPKLVVPAEGMAPRLLMEWISGRSRHRATLSVLMKEREGSPVFIIRLPFLQSAEELHDIKHFINANL